MKSDDKPTVFVSHHSSKADVAAEVEAALGKRGVKCWIAPRDVDPGEPFDTSVRHAIERSSAVLLLFCAESDRSRHVKRELILADSAEKPIIPVRLEKIHPGELAYHLADSQWIDWVERREAVMDRVAEKARRFDKTRRDVEGRRAIAARAAATPNTPANDAAPPRRLSAESWKDSRRKRALALFAALGAAVLLWQQPWSDDGEGSGFSVSVDESSGEGAGSVAPGKPPAIPDPPPVPGIEIIGPREAGDAGNEAEPARPTIRVDRENRRVVIDGGTGSEN